MCTSVNNLQQNSTVAAIASYPGSYAKEPGDKAIAATASPRVHVSHTSC